MGTFKPQLPLFTLAKIKPKAFIVVLCFLACLIGSKAQAELSLESIHQPRVGGVALIPLPPDIEKVYWGKKQVMIIKSQEGRDYALVGIPLTASAGFNQLILLKNNQTEKVRFKVQPHAYDEQHIEVKESRYVNPEPFDLDRIQLERKSLNNAIGSFKEVEWVAEELDDFDQENDEGGEIDEGDDDKTREKKPLKPLSVAIKNLEMAKPAEGRYTSFFGLRRFFNGEKRNPHKGIDIAGSKGDDIVAALGGEVVLVGDFFFNGKTIVLDHKQGLKTIYIHLDEVLVEQGDLVKKNQVIAKMGQTGRTTGVHLHFGVYLNGSSVDPLIFLSP